MKIVATLLAGAALAMSGAADAAVTVIFNQSGADVVATTSGSLNLTGLNYLATGSTTVGVRGDGAAFGTGGNLDIYGPIASGPFAFGTGYVIDASSFSGDAFYIYRLNNVVGVKAGYVSGSAISATTTFLGQTFDSMGLTVGNYVFGVGQDIVTIEIGTAAPAVPEPASWALMIGGFALAGVALRRRRIATVRYA